MRRKWLILLLICANLGCSTIVYRVGQPALIGEPERGTPTHAVLLNREGEAFAIPRGSISGVRYGGMRTALWSLLAMDAALFIAPFGLWQWSNEIAALDGIGGRADVQPVVDEEEVSADALGAP